ncbi:MAG: acyltransferase [Saprospiraceae bacterium]|nr:acyltransferase [Saprospiraceae bacterium]
MILRIFGKILQKWIAQRQRAIRAKFHRTLPANELMVDRWEKARQLGFGEGTSIYDSALVFGDVQIGSQTWVGPFVILEGTGGLKIGNNCSISASVHIYTHDTVQWAISGGRSSYEYAPVEIGNNCYIGPHCVIAKGVTLGDGCVVGANSFVNSSFGPGIKLAGNPAKEI